MKRIILIASLLAASSIPARADFLETLFGPQGVTVSNSRTRVARHYRSVPLPPRRPKEFGALASFYGGGEKLNSHTASGERFRPGGMTAAHRALPLGTRLLVSYRGRSVVVRINDRGPAAWTGRSLDLARGAAARLGMPGVAPVRVAILD